MVDRDSWGHSYLTVRGEILGFVKDGLLLGLELVREVRCTQRMNVRVRE